MNPEIAEEEEKEGEEVGELGDLGEISYHPVNMLEESHLNMGELRMFHEKDDISYLFNFPKAIEE